VSRLAAPQRRVVDRGFRSPFEIVERLDCGHEIVWEVRVGIYQTSRSERRACAGCRDGAPIATVDHRTNVSFR
jgi:hypothetical protein